jgi:alpha-galactosidase
LSPGFGIAVDVRREDVDWVAVRKAAADWLRAAPYMLSDFYPLTSYTLDENTWIAWQFHDPATGSGMVQAFRRKDALTDTACFSLRNLTAEAQYAVTDLDGGEPVEYSGQALTQPGLPVALNTRPAAAILLYERIPQGASA